MAESKLAYLLSRFSEAELQAFAKQLPGVPSRREEVLLQVLALMKEGIHDNETLYGTIYPGKPFSDKQIRNLRSDLYKRLEDYLIHLELGDSPDRLLYLLRALNKRGPHEQTLKLAEKSTKNSFANPDSLDRLTLSSQFAEETLAARLLLSERKSADYNALIDLTEEAFVARVLYQRIGYHEDLRMYKESVTPPPSPMWPAILKAIEEGHWKNSPLIQIYHALYQLISQTAKVGGIGNVQAKLTAHQQDIAKIEMLKAYHILLNYCKVILNKGHDWIIEDLFQLYERMLDLGLLEIRGIFEHWHFKSIVVLGLRTGRVNWTESFIREKSPSLATHFQNQLEPFACGLVAFSRSDFAQALKFMIKAENTCKDPFLVLDIKSYLLRIYYETENMIGVESLLNSFRLFIRRHKHLPQKRLKNYKEFVRFFRRFIALDPGNLNQVRKLYQEVLASQQYACRGWLIEKMQLFVYAKVPDLSIDKPGTLSI